MMRWLGRLAGAIAVLVLLAVALPFLIPAQTVARLASAQIERLTGRSLTIEGGLHPTIWPQLGVRTGPVALANADWSDAGPMLRAQSLSAGVDLASLLGGMVRVTAIELNAPQLLLERAADGRVNWSLAAQPGERAVPDNGGSADQTPFTIDRAVIDAGTIRYTDHGTGAVLELSSVAVSAAIPDYQGSAQMAADAVINGQPVSLTASIGRFAPFLNGKVVPADLSGTVAGAGFSFDGRLGLAPLAADGKAALTVSDIPAFFAALGRAAPDLPQGLGRGRIGLDGVLTLTPGQSVHLRDGTILLDDNRLTGAFDLVPGKDRPALTARLSAAALDFAAVAGGGAAGGGSAGSGGTAPAGWSGTPVDASVLGLADVALTLAADSVDLGPVSLGRTRAGVRVDAGRAVADLREVALYGGTLAGQVIVNARKGLSARASLKMNGLALQPLLMRLAGTDRLTGTGDLQMNLLGSGGSVDAMMRSLTGDAGFVFRAGEWRGLDLAGMVRTLDAGYAGDGAGTVFDSISAGFTVKGGIAETDDFALNGPLIAATGAGKIDIGGRSLSFRLIPLRLAGQALDSGVQVPVLVSGPWAAPQVGPDLETLARRRLDEEKQKLEDRARAEIGQRLQEETGIAPAPGESLEDTARRAAEQLLQNSAQEALDRLLGTGSGGE